MQITQGLVLPQRLEIDQATLTDQYGRFFAEPFEKWFLVCLGQRQGMGDCLLKHPHQRVVKGPVIKSVSVGERDSLLAEVDRQLGHAFGQPDGLPVIRDGFFRLGY